jgi:hypothetical protein
MVERCGSRGGASYLCERCGSRCGASYFMSRYVDSDGFLGRCDITAAQSTARRLYTVPLVVRCDFARGTQIIFSH